MADQEPARHTMCITRYPGRDVVLEIDGKPARYVTGKFTLNVITMTYEEIPQEGQNG